MKQFLSIRHPAFKVFILVASVFILYSFILSAPFKTLDDQASIYANRDIQDIKYIPQIFRKSFFGDDNFYYRPLVSVSFSLENHFFGLNAFFFNVTNMLLHLLTTLVVFCFVTFVFKNDWLGFWVAFLFAIHPVNVEAVANVAGRSILLCAFFEWSAFLLFGSFVRYHKRIYFLGSLFSFALALLSKESSAAFPAMVFIYAFLFSERPKRSFWGSVRLAIPFALVLAGYLIARYSLHIASVSFVSDVKDYFYGILTFARSVLTYGRILLWPVDLHFDRIRPVIGHVFSPESLGTIVFWLGSLGAFLKFYRRLTPAVLFFIALFFFRFLPLSQIIPIRSQANYICIPDHFLYVPSVGFFVCLVVFFRWAAGRLMATQHLTRFWVRSIVSLWIIFLACITIEQNIYATHEIALFERTVSFTPEHVRINVALGLSYVFQKKFARAEPCFRRALAYEPSNTRARVSLGTVLLDQGRYWEGLAEYEKIFGSRDFQDLVERNKKLAYRLLIEKYSAMIKGKDTPADVYYSLGVVYAKKGDFKDAIVYFQKALERDPRHRNALINLCNSFWAAGQEQDAQTCFAQIKEP